MEIVRCPIFVPRRPTGVRRILHLLTFAATSFPVLVLQLLWQPRIVMVVAPTLFAVPVALVLARAVGAVTWLHVQDFDVEAAYQLGLLRTAAMGRFINICEAWLLRRFDRVSTISIAMRARLEQKGVARERLDLLPNWVDTSVIYPIGVPSVFRERLGIGNGRVVALYSGAMGAKQGLELIIEAAQLLQAEPVEFVLCGDGPERTRIGQLAEGLSNLRFLPLQPASELNQLLNLADIHLLPQRPGVADLVMPSKLAGMLASGKPVVATAAADTQVFRAVSGCGRIVAPDDAHGFASAIAELAKDPALRAFLGALGRSRAESEMGRAGILNDLNRKVSSLAGF